MRFLELGVRMAMYISEDKVSLRDFSAEDSERKVQWINDPRNNEYLHYDLPLVYDKTLKWFLGRNLAKRLDCTIEYDGVPVGLIGLLEIDYFHKKAEFYICLGEHQYKGRGIAKASIKMLIKYAFCELGLNKVYLNVDADNEVACKLYERSGFTCEGCFKKDMFHRGRYIDRKRYAILAESWGK